MVCHKIIQHADGTLTLGAVPAMSGKYSQTQSTNVMASNGYSNGTLTGDDAYVLYSRLGYHNHLSFTVTTSNNWDKFGISLVRNADAKKSKHSFSYQRPQNCEKTQKKCKIIWSCQKKVVILHDFFAD